MKSTSLVILIALAPLCASCLEPAPLPDCDTPISGGSPSPTLPPSPAPGSPTPTGSATAAPSEPPSAPPSPTAAPTAAATLTVTPTASPTATPTAPPTPTATAATPPTPTGAQTAAPTPTGAPSPATTASPSLATAGEVATPSWASPQPSPSPFDGTPRLDVDHDGDGFTTLEGDCAPLDPASYPGAPERPFDGRDDDCDGLEDLATTIVGARLNEGGPPETARMDAPTGLAQATDGALYYADASQCRVRRIAGGVITTLVGTGTCGFNGDGWPSTEAMLSGPAALALDEARGWLLIADTGNHRLRRLTLDTGILDTLAGNGLNSDPIDGAFATAVPLGNPTAVTIAERTGGIFVALSAQSGARVHGGVWRLDPAYDDLFKIQRVAGSYVTSCGTATPGAANKAALCQVGGIAVSPDGGTVYLSQYMEGSQSVIAQVEGGTLSYLVGDGGPCELPVEEVQAAETAALCHPLALALTAEGDLTFTAASPGLAQLRLEEGEVRWLAGDDTWVQDALPEPPPWIPAGPALEVPLGAPRGLAGGGDGPWLLADTQVGVLRWYSGGEAPFLATAAGVPAGGFRDGPAEDALLQGPTDVHLWEDPGTGAQILFIADAGSAVVREVQGGRVSTLAGVQQEAGRGLIPPGSPAVGTPIPPPLAVTVDDAGVAYVLVEGDVVLRIQGGLLERIAGGGSLPSAEGDGQPAVDVDLQGCADIAVSPDGRTLIIAEGGADRFRAVDLSDGGEGLLSTRVGIGLPGELEPGAAPGDTPVTRPTAALYHGGVLYVSDAETIARVGPGGMEILATSPQRASDLGLDVPEVIVAADLYRFALDPWGRPAWSHRGQAQIYGIGADGSHTGVLLGSIAAGRTSYNADEGPADQIWLSPGLNGLVFSSQGDLLVSDQGHHVIRRVRW